MNSYLKVLLIFLTFSQVAFSQDPAILAAVKKIFGDTSAWNTLIQSYYTAHSPKYPPAISVPAKTPTSSPVSTPAKASSPLNIPSPVSPSPKVWGSQPSPAKYVAPSPIIISSPSPKPSPSPSPSPTASPSPSPTASPPSSPATTSSPVSTPVPSAPSSPSSKGSCFQLKGVNQAGADFGSPGGAYGTAYEYPEPNGSTASFVKIGMNVMRMPFLLERLFPDAKNFDTTEWGRFQASVTAIIAAGSQVIIDPHNYFRFNNEIIGTSSCQLSVQGYADLYAKIATAYKGNSKVIFALMNEPHDISSTADIMTAWKTVIAAIRGAGANNLILASGNSWDSAPNWFGTYYGGADSDNMKSLLTELNDPNVYPEMHMYLDSDSSGSSADCVSETIGVERLSPVTDWLKSTGNKGVLTEIGVGTSATCLTALDNTLQHMQDNCDAWAGFTYWAAGPMWGDYRYTIDPTTGTHPQTAIIQKHL